jgi:hypothetical protein
MQLGQDLVSDLCLLSWVSKDWALNNLYLSNDCQIHHIFQAPAHLYYPDFLFESVGKSIAGLINELGYPLDYSEKDLGHHYWGFLVLQTQWCKQDHAVGTLA